MSSLIDRGINMQVKNICKETHNIEDDKKGDITEYSKPVNSCEEGDQCKIDAYQI